MRFAIYGLLVLLGVGGLLFGLNGLGDPRTEGLSLLFILTGTVALGSLGVVMAIEHASGVQLAELREMRRDAAKRAGEGK